MIKHLTLLAKVPCALIVGLLSVGLFFQEDPWLKQRIETYINDSTRPLIGEPFRFTVESCNMFTGTITGALKTFDRESNWSFTCDAVRFHISWLSRVYSPTLRAEIHFNKPSIKTTYSNGTFALSQPIKAIILSPSHVPFKVVNCSITEGDTVITHEKGECKLTCSSSTDVLEHSVKTSVAYHDGSIAHKSDMTVSSLTGSGVVDVPLKDTQSYICTFQCTGRILRAERLGVCTFLVTYGNGIATCRAHSETRNIQVLVDNIGVQQQNIPFDFKIQGYDKSITDLRYLLRAEDTALKDVIVESSSVIAGKGIVSENDVTYQGTATCNQVSYGDLAAHDMLLIFNGTMDMLAGTVETKMLKNMLIAGTWKADIKNAVYTSSLQLKQPYAPISKVVLNAGALKLKMAGGATTGTYDITGKTALKDALRLQGTIARTDNTVLMKGSCNDYTFRAHWLLQPLKLEMLTVSDNHHKELLHAKRKGNTFKGTLEFEPLKKLIQVSADLQINGQAQVSFSLDVQKEPYALDIKTDSGEITIPSIYQVIKSAKASLLYYPQTNTLKIPTAQCDFHKGFLRINNAECVFADAQRPPAMINAGQQSTFGLASVSIPLEGQITIGWRKDLTGTCLLNGKVLYMNQRWHVEGTVMVDNAQFESNLLSVQGQKDLFRTAHSLSTIDIDILLKTKNPLEIKAPFFKAQAVVNAQVKGTTAHPLISGTIELVNGAFAFPYKPLYVTSAKLYLMPHQQGDPTVELTAKNAIKKYAITMNVTGTLHHPHITFESSPHLTQEQIIALLLSGSEDSPLYMAVPSMLMLQLESLLFGSSDHVSKAQQFFKGLFKNIRFIPYLSNDAGKGPKGAIEIDITDRLRAKAQNDLTFSKQTELEVEYAVTDDMRIKAVRDDKGAIGGEIEMRWKF